MQRYVITPALVLLTSLLLASGCRTTNDAGGSAVKDDASVTHIPAPVALDPSQLPAGSILQMVQNTATIVPGAINFMSFSDPPTNTLFGCTMQFTPALFQRTIPAQAQFVLVSAKLNALDQNGSSNDEFAVSSTGAPFVTKILCQNNEGKNNEGDPTHLGFTMQNLACLFNVLITAPQGATNPDLVCAH